MSKIFVDQSALKKAFIGSSAIKSVYMDSTMVWQSAVPVQKPTNLTPTAVYSGSTITNGYTRPEGVNITGVSSGVSASTYTATYTPDSEHMWADTEDRAPVTVTLTITRRPITEFTLVSAALNYTGSQVSATVATVKAGTLTATYSQSGTWSATNGGSYTATVTGTGNFQGTMSKIWEVRYVWQKWESKILYSDSTVDIGNNTTIFSGDNVYKYCFNYGTSTPVIDQEEGKFDFNDISSISSYDWLSGGRYMPVHYKFSSPKTEEDWDTRRKTDSYFELTEGNSNYVTVRFFSAGYVATTGYGKGVLHTITSSWIKGDVQLTTVYSTTNINAYPQNGRASDGYWYVKTW